MRLALRACVPAGFHALQMKTLHSGPPSIYSLYLETSAPTPCGTPPLAGPQWTVRNHPDLPYVISHTLGELHNKSSTISPPDVDTRAQASPPARSIKRYLLKRCVQYCGIPGIRHFQTALAALERLTGSQHGSSSSDSLRLRILIPPPSSLLPPKPYPATPPTPLPPPPRRSILKVLAVERATMSSEANHI